MNSSDSVTGPAITTLGFTIKYPALQDFSACLFQTCEIMIDAAKALNVKGDPYLKHLKKQALTFARKATKDHAKCQDVPECEARSMLKVNLFKSWPILDYIARNLPVDTESQVQFRDKVISAVEEIDNCGSRNSKSNRAILDNHAAEEQIASGPMIP
jgi:hypothetical protein